MLIRCSLNLYVCFSLILKSMQTSKPIFTGVVGLALTIFALYYLKGMIKISSVDIVCVSFHDV